MFAEEFADPDFIPPPSGSEYGSVELRSSYRFIQMQYTSLPDSDWMLIGYLDQDNHMVIHWRMHYFGSDDSDDTTGKCDWYKPEHQAEKRWSWHGIQSREPMDYDKALEKMEESASKVAEGWNKFCGEDVDVKVLKLDCPGDEVFEKILEDAPWYPIPDPLRLACKDELR